MPDLKFCICGKIIAKSDKYCDKCKSKISKKNSAKNKQYDKYNRDKRSRAFYNSALWHKLVVFVRIKYNNMCALCYHNNVAAKGEVVHHIKPIKEDWEHRLDSKNCILLCNKCHSEVHAAYDKNLKSKKDMENLLRSLAE